jgi:hypothetical protein
MIKDLKDRLDNDGKKIEIQENKNDEQYETLDWHENKLEDQKNQNTEQAELLEE